MSFAKKVGAALLAAVMMLCICCSCNQSATKVIMTVNGEEIPSGIYLIYLNNAISELDEKISEAEYKGDRWAFTDSEITNAAQWVKDTALQYTLELVAVEKKFKEMELSFTAEEQSNIDYICDYYWSYLLAASYEDMGISFASYKRVYTMSSMGQKILLAMYDKEGTSPISEDELKAYMNENYMRVNHILISSKDDSQKDLTGDELAAAEALAKKLNEEAKTATDEKFKELVIANSADYDSETDTESTLDLGMITPVENSGYVTEFEECAAGLKAGETGFCKSEYGWHIVRRYEMFGDDEVSLDDYRTDVILTMKEDSYNDDRAAWADALKDQMTVVQASVNRYDPTDKKFQPASDSEEAE